MDEEIKAIRQFMALFNRNGYVLDFSNASYNLFTSNSIGVPLQSVYGGSKGKSLEAYLTDKTISEKDKWKLISDLFAHYEEKYEQEYNPDLKDDSYIAGIDLYGLKYDAGYSRLYNRCKSILAEHAGDNAVTSLQTTELKERVFSSEYIHKEIDSMYNEVTTSPTDAIGKSKELIESCCKSILDEMNVKWSKNWDLPTLCNETLGRLNLTPRTILDTDPVNEQLKAVCGNLRGIVTKLGEIRNVYGSGHGKDDEFKGLEERHAKLAVGCSSTFCIFVWDTWQEMKSQQRNE